MNPSLTVGTRRDPLGISAWRSIAHRILKSSRVPVHSVLVQKSVTTITNAAGRLSTLDARETPEVSQDARGKKMAFRVPVTSPMAGLKCVRMASRIMYIESRAESLNGPARIGRVTFSRTRSTLYYKDKTFQSLKGSGFKANYFDVETSKAYWISGPRRDGQDRLYASNIPVEIDEDCREESWTQIRKKPELKARSQT